MKRLRRRLAWLLVRLAERIDPDWYLGMIEQRRSGLDTDDSPSFEYQSVTQLRERGFQRINNPKTEGPPIQWTGAIYSPNMTGPSPKRSA